MPDSDPHEQLEVSVRASLSDEITVSRNVSQNVIVISDDRALLRAREFESAIKSRIDISFPLGLLVGIVITFATAEFHDAFGLRKEIWSAIFVFAAVLCLAWIIIGLYRMWTSQGMTPEQFVQQLGGRHLD